MSESMNNSASSAITASAPLPRLERLKKLLQYLQFNLDMSVNATLLGKHFAKSNQDYEQVNKAYLEELCTRYSCKMGDLIREGTRGRLTKGAEAGSNARRYSKDSTLLSGPTRLLLPTFRRPCSSSSPDRSQQRQA